MKTKTRDWKPVRNGARYCAPACGRGCTYAEYRRARAQANRWAQRLRNVPTDVQRGPWKINVWENLGWYWSISKGAVELHYSQAAMGGYFTAYLQAPGPWGGNLVISGDGAKPEVLVAKLLDQARQELKPWLAFYERLGGKS